MNIKYKLRHKDTGREITDIRSWIVNKNGYLVKVVLFDGSEVNPEHYDIDKFLEKVGGIDIYDNDYVLADVVYYGYRSDEDLDISKIEKRMVGTFEESREEGIYCFVPAEGEGSVGIAYLADDTKIIQFLK